MKSATKVSLTENFQQQSCNTIISFLTVHRLQRETQSFNLKFSLEVTYPLKIGLRFEVEQASRGLSAIVELLVTSLQRSCTAL